MLQYPKLQAGQARRVPPDDDAVPVVHDVGRGAVVFREGRPGQDVVDQQLRGLVHHRPEHLRPVQRRRQLPRPLRRRQRRPAEPVQGVEFPGRGLPCLTTY